MHDTYILYSQLEVLLIIGSEGEKEGKTTPGCGTALLPIYTDFYGLKVNMIQPIMSFCKYTEYKNGTKPDSTQRTYI